jgi:hypothetical protein
VGGGWMAVARGPVSSEVDRSRQFEELVHAAYRIDITTILERSSNRSFGKIFGLVFQPLIHNGVADL